MNCPRCSSSMSELDRDGITIDRCERCRGVWLDRGELEKLLALASPERGDGRGGNAIREDRDRSYRRRDDDDDDDDHGYRGDRRRSWWEIFD